MNIWVNGTFDIIHSGHIDLLWFAKMFDFNTNKLIVGLDSDDRVKTMKGEDRPINNIDDRVKLISNLKMVDEVVVFNTDNELRRKIKENNIDYIVIGDDYRNKTVIGEEYSKNGVYFFPKTNQSTSRIIQKIKK